MGMPQVPVTAKFIDLQGAVSAVWMKFFQALVAQARVGMIDAPTITVDASKGSVFDVTLGGNRALAAPLYPTDGQLITIRLKQDGTGGRTVTWDASFHFGTDVAMPTLTTAAGKTDQVEFRYNAGTAAWECVRVARGYP
jgi:hypothetical protein